MDNSRGNQTELSYRCNAGSASLNLYTGRLLFEHFDTSIGLSPYNFYLSHIYNTHFELPETIKTYVGNHWKLNVQQYLYANEDAYTYIDNYGVNHTFERLSENEYYDTSGLGLLLQVGDESIISDLMGNKLYFQGNYLVKSVSANEIIQVYEHNTDGQLVAIYFSEENVGTIPNIKLVLEYGYDKLMKRIKLYEDNKLQQILHYYYRGTNNLRLIYKRVFLNDGTNTKVKDYTKFEYLDNQLTYIIDLLYPTNINYNALKITYQDKKVSEIVNELVGIVEAEAIYETKPSYYVGEDLLYLGEEIFLGEVETTFKTSIGDILNYDRNTFVYNNNNTEVTNKKGIILTYFFDKDGRTTTVFEKVNSSNNGYYRSLQVRTGIQFSLNGVGDEKINGSATYQTTADQEIVSTLTSEITLEKENYLCHFWFKTNKKVYSNVVVVELLNEEETVKTIIGRYDNEVINTWQEISVPLTGINGSVITGLKVKFSLGTNENEITLSDIYLSPSSISEVIIKNSTTEVKLKEIKKIKYNKYQVNNLTNVVEEVEVEETIFDPEYITEQDLLFTNINRYLTNKDDLNQPYFLYLNNLQKRVLVDNVVLYYGDDDEELSLDYAIDNSENKQLYEFPYYRQELSDDLSKTINQKTSLYEQKDVFGIGKLYDCICIENNVMTVNNSETVSVTTYQYYDLKGNLLLSEDYYGVQQIYYSEDNFNHYEIIKHKNTKIELKDNEIVLATSNPNDALYKVKFVSDASSMTAYYDVMQEDNEVVYTKEYYKENYNKLLGTLQQTTHGYLKNEGTSQNKLLNKTTYQYDEYQNKLNKITFLDGNNQQLGVSNFTYSASNKLSQVDDDLNNYKYTYSNYGENLEIKDVLLDKTVYSKSEDRNQDEIVTTIRGNEKTQSYNKYGQLKEVSLNGYTIGYDYNDCAESLALAKVNKITVKKGDDLVANYIYKYDNNNLLKNYTYAEKRDRISYEEDSGFKEVVNVMEYDIDVMGKNSYIMYEEEDFPNNDNDNTTSVTKYGDTYRSQVNYDIDNLSDSRVVEHNTYVGNGTLATDSSTIGLISIYNYDNIGRYIEKKMIIDPNITNDSISNQKTYNSVNSSLQAENIYKIKENSGETTRELLYNFTYNYDNGNLSSMKRSDEEEAATYKYDGSNQLIEEYVPSTKETKKYEYTTSGNISSITVMKDDTIIKERKYVYENGQLTGITTNTINNEITYDTYGNCTSFKMNDVEYILEWNSSNQLTKVIKKDASGNESTISYEYDATGKRKCKKYSEGILTDYVYDNNRLTEEYIYLEGKYIRLSYIYDKDGVAGFVKQERTTPTEQGELKIYYYIKDALGNVVAISEQDKIVVRYEYDAWGNSTIKTDMTEEGIGYLNPFRYRGYYYDEETGWFWLSSRYYSPELCRFISPDDVSYLNPKSVNGLNLYCYCYNNPISYYDPSGHIALWLLGGIVLGAIGLIGGGVYAGVKSSQAGNTGWDLVGDIALGALIGGAVGFAAGALLGAGISGALTGSFASGVKEVVAGGIRVYQMAKYGGGTAAAYMMLDNLYQSFHHTQHVFWSGGDIAMNRAMEYATQNGATTLEMTGTGAYLQTYFSGQYYNPLAWNIASQNFANQVHYGETVRAILYYPGMRETAIWFSEEAILLERLAEIIRGGL